MKKPNNIDLWDLGGRKLAVVFMLIALVFSTSQAFAWYTFRKDFQGCNDHAYKSCPWNGKKYKLPEQDPAFVACSQPIFDYCRCKYYPSLVETRNVDKNCTVLLTKYDY